MNELENARRELDNWCLGKTSAHHESSGQGAEAISMGKGDHGGVSYGAYQLSTKMGTLNEYLQQSRYGGTFRGLEPDTPDFNAKWRTLAKTDPGFAKDQHDFIGRSHYTEQLSALSAAGIQLSNRGRAVQDAIWSTSVQFRNLTPRIFARGLADKFGEHFELPALTDKQIIEAVQDYKIAHNSSLFKSSPEWQPGLLRRAYDEKTNLLKLATQEQLIGDAGFGPSNEAQLARVAETKANRSIDRNAADGDSQQVGARNERIRSLQGELHKLGYTDLHGRFLAIDGAMGPNTQHAIKSFQHAHHLKVDGIVGNDTRAALIDAHHSPLLSEATHPRHHLYAQVLHGIRQLPTGTYRNEQERTNAAVALTISADVAGLRKIDHVVLGRNGTNLFAVQGRIDDPAHRRVYIDHDQAMSRSVDHATSALQASQIWAHPVQSQVEQRTVVQGIDR
jgi:hypothetical protein